MSTVRSLAVLRLDRVHDFAAGEEGVGLLLGGRVVGQVGRVVQVAGVEDDVGCGLGLQGQLLGMMDGVGKGGHRLVSGQFCDLPRSWGYSTFAA